MTEFAYNNIKNANIEYTFFKFNCRYYLYISPKKDISLYFRSKIANELTKKLRNLMTI